MAARQGDWHLLGADGDPVPGDWSAIQDAGRHYASVARDIAAQVRRLRTVADDDQILRGEYADGLREACRQTADDLDRVHARFEEVGSALGGWWEPVQDARTTTWSALQAAEEAQRTIDANPPADPPAPGAPAPTDAEQTAQDRTDTRRGNAETALSNAQSSFDTAVADYGDKARQVAKAIRDAADDDFKDSGWDGFKNWIDENADILKVIADVISIVVTIAAIVFLFVTPAGWILLAVAAVAVIGLGIRAALAATGNGSWADFALDLVGVLTLGTGRIAIAVARAGRAATLSAIASRAGSTARAAAVANARAAFAQASLFSKPAVWLFKSNPAMRWIAGRAAYTSTKLAWLTKPLPSVTKLETVMAGMDDVAAAMSKELPALAREFPDLVTAGYRWGHATALTAARTGATVDAIDKLVGGISIGDVQITPPLGPVGEIYDDAKDSTTYAPGGHLG